MINQKILRDIAFDIYNNTNGYSIIAGGAPRDIDLGVQPKDVDVFVEVADQQEEDDYLSFMQNEMGYREVGQAEGEEYEMGLNPIQSVWDYAAAFDAGEPGPINQIPVQFIFLKRDQMPEEDHIAKRVFKLFDVNICRIALWYDFDSDKTKIYKGDYYKNGVVERRVFETNDFYHDRNLNQRAKDNTRRRIQRIARKLGWKASYGHSDIQDRETFDFRPQLVEAPEVDRVWELYQRAINNQINPPVVAPPQYVPGQYVNNLAPPNWAYEWARPM